MFGIVLFLRLWLLWSWLLCFAWYLSVRVFLTLISSSLLLSFCSILNSSKNTIRLYGSEWYVVRIISFASKLLLRQSLFLWLLKLYSLEELDLFMLPSTSVWVGLGLISEWNTAQDVTAEYMSEQLLPSICLPWASVVLVWYFSGIPLKNYCRV